jgi:hypothetical protein
MKVVGMAGGSFLFDERQQEGRNVDWRAPNSESEETGKRRLQERGRRAVRKS